MPWWSMTVLDLEIWGDNNEEEWDDEDSRQQGYIHQRGHTTGSTCWCEYKTLCFYLYHTLLYLSTLS